MADQFQIPQRTPPAPQFTPPTDLVTAYLNRPTGYQLGSQAIGQGLRELVDYQLKQQQLKGAAFEQGGPYLMNMLYGPKTGAPPAPSMPSYQGPTGKSPDDSDPDQSSAAAQPPATPNAPQAQQSSVPETIQASLNMGHPDFLGLMNQAAQYQNMGKYGREQIQNLQSQGNLAMLPMQAQKTQNELAMQPLNVAEKAASIRASNSKFANPEQGAAIASGSPSAIADAYGGVAPVEAYNQAANKAMEVKKTIAGEVSKESESSQRIGQLKTLASNLSKTLEKYQPGILGNQLGQVYQATGGRYGSPGAAAIQNASNPLATALNTELSRRFNSGEVELLTNSLIPQPKDTPQYAKQKLANLNSLINSMATGNENNVRNVAAAITSGAIPNIAQQAQPQAAPVSDMVTIRDSQGGLHTLPSKNLDAARKRDPGLTVVNE